MDKTDKRIFLTGFLLLLTLSCVVAKRLYNRLHPAPQAVSASAQTVIGTRLSDSGSNGPAYVLVTFSDYQCPYCVKAEKEIPALAARHQNLRVVFRNNPLSFHKFAMPAALLAEEARQQGKYPEVHEALFELKGNLDPEALAQLRARYQLAKQPSTVLRAEAVVNGDMQTATALKVKGTPTFFLCAPDGKVWRLLSLKQIEDMVP